jgi:hypothetical protein
MTEVYAQQSTSSQTEWFKTIGIYDEELVNALIPTSDGGYAVAGLASSPALSAAANQPVSYFWLVKIDSGGDIQWSNIYPQTGNDAGANSVVQTSDGGYALIGTSIPSNGTDQEVWLIKTDSNGNLQWNKIVETGYTYNSVISLLQTKGGDYVLDGSGSSGATGNTGWLIETESNGNLLWKQTYENVVPRALIQTSDGGFAIASASGELIKTDSKGNVNWETSYPSGTLNFGGSLFQTSDGGYAIAGVKNVPGTEPSSTGGSQVWLVKTDSQGNLQWQSTLNSSTQIDSVTNLIQTKDGGYAIAGSIEASLSSKSYAFLFKTDSKGNMEWTQNYAESLTTIENGLIQNSDRGFILAGSSTGSSSNNGAWLIKTDDNGNAPPVSVSAVYDLSSPSPVSTSSPSPSTASTATSTPTSNSATTLMSTSTIIVVISIVLAVVVCSGLLVYFKKLKPENKSPGLNSLESLGSRVHLVPIGFTS